MEFGKFSGCLLLFPMIFLAGFLLIQVHRPITVEQEEGGGGGCLGVPRAELAIAVATAAFTVGNGAAAGGASSRLGGKAAASAIMMTACDFKASPLNHSDHPGILPEIMMMACDLKVLTLHLEAIPPHLPACHSLPTLACGTLIYGLACMLSVCKIHCNI